MATEFGKALRKLRIDNDELLKDMALKLEVTISYLSAVENGKREVPEQWIEVLSKQYSLKSNQKQELENLAYKSKKKISIDLNDVDDERKITALAFARRFDSFSDEEINQIYKIVYKEGED